MQQQRRGFALHLPGQTLLVAAAAWLAGILLEAWTQTWVQAWAQIPAIAFLAAAATAGACAVACKGRGRGLLIALLVAACLLLGAWRYATVSPAADPSSIRAFIGTKALEVDGSIADEPRLEGRSTLLVIDTQQISLDGGQSWRDAHGQIEVVIPGSLLDDPYGPRYGDAIEMQGTLLAPSSNSSPEIFASMAFPRLAVEQSGGNPFIAALYQLRTTTALIIERSLPQPMAALLIALVLSLHTPALRPLIPAFNTSGTAHLIAPSGLKITILAGLIAGLTRRFTPRRMRKQQFRPLLPAERQRQGLLRLPIKALIIASIIVYTFLSGGGPAALRAGIMGILLIMAPRNGRVYNVYTALAFSALLESALNPYVLWDAGFQLSFLGTLGIVLLTPVWMRLFHSLERFWLGSYIAETFAVTLAAEIATLPIFALTFHTVSLIALLTNMLTLPLLAILIFLGLLLCGAGLVAAPAALFVGRLTWSLLWYMRAVILWCAQLPYAYLSVTNLNVAIAWVYYGILCVVVTLLLRRWPLSTPNQSHLLTGDPPPPRPSRRTRRVMRAGLALLIFLATGTATLAARPGPQVTITFLDVGPATRQAAQTSQPAQGEAILVRTPEGKTALIDGGPDATSLAEALDSHLPFWQRSLDLVILTAPRQDNLVGLEDIVTRYSVGEVVDAGMLHPNTGYARFRNIISARGLNYQQLRQGAVFTLGAEVTFQVFWPTSPLHKSSQENEDNGMVVRLLAPGLRLLLLGNAAMSKYALQDGIVSTIDKSYLAADVVQLAGEAGKPFPTALNTLLEAVHPSLIVVTPTLLSPKLRKAGASSVLTSLPFAGGSWQIVQTAQTGEINISCDASRWRIQTDG